jgi:pyruvate dehydrogenase E2 component (dihydrolipoamide acetyltransferase)
MSTYEFKLPDIGEGVTEGEIVKWLVAPGDVVTEDQPMVEVMTDKATVTITSPKAGTITETRGGVGAIVPVHAVLVVFDLGGGTERPAPAPAPGSVGQPGGPGLAKKDDGPAATAVGDIREDLPGMQLAAPRITFQKNGSATAQTAGYFNAKPLATPATRKHARDLGIDLRTVSPTGSGGRVTKDDVSRMGATPLALDVAFDQARTLVPPRSVIGSDEGRSSILLDRGFDEARTLVPPPKVPNASAQRVPQAVPPTSAAEERFPLRGVRKRIFEGMSRSKHTAAHFTFVEECDATALVALRDRLRAGGDRAGIKLTFLPFIVKAVVAALKRHPALTSAFDETTNEIVVRNRYDIGVATSTDSGLMVPVVRNADRRSILEIARDISRLSDEAKSGRSRPEDLGNSTFTITSLGAQGGLFATPILNHPEVGILGVHRIKEKPVVKNGQIVIGNVMLLSLSFDHRIIDGHVGAAFAYEIINFLEDPDRLFLEMA